MNRTFKNQKINYFAVTACLFLSLSGAAFAQEREFIEEAPVQDEASAPQSELEKMKKEWEAVRDQQIQMIREKEDQLEKLKEEIFAKMKTSGISVAPPAEVKPEFSKASEPILPIDTAGAAGLAGSAGLEAQREALQAERQKFFAEMNRQKENLLQFQASLDIKAKQLEAERERFEEEKKAAAA